MHEKSNLMRDYHFLEKLAAEFNFEIQKSFINAPLLLCGIERGGTGIGARILGAHPSFNCIRYGGSSRFDSFFYKNINRLGEGLAEQIFSKIVMRERVQVLFHFSEYSGNTSPYHKAVREAFGTKDRYASFYSLLALLEAAGRGDELRPFWLDKAIGIGLGDRFLKHFQQGRLIYLLRDPRDTVTSQLGIRKQVGQQHSLYQMAKLSMKVRRHFQEAYELQRKYSEKVWVIRYEDLIKSPIEVTAPIFSSMGLRELSEQDLSSLNSTQNKASYDRYVNYHGISTKSAYRWKKDNTIELNQQIESLLKKWMRKAGYELTDMSMVHKTTLQIQALACVASISEARKYIPRSLKYALKSLVKR